LVLLPLLLAWAAAPVGAAERLAGIARVVDGDTLDVAGVRVRLKGVAAPELREPGGEEARAFVAGLVEGQTVVCELTGERTRGRRVGYCSREGRDIAAEVIRAGLARDCPRYSQGRYAAAEPEASRRLPFPDYTAGRGSGCWRRGRDLVHEGHRVLVAQPGYHVGGRHHVPSSSVGLPIRSPPAWRAVVNGW
jgi:hypothetical protein